VVGLGAAAALRASGSQPSLILSGILLFVFVEVISIGFFTAVADFLLGGSAWWSIAAPNLLAVFGMIYSLWIRHPEAHSSIEQ
jgi:hypothetical protein